MRMWLSRTGSAARCATSNRSSLPPEALRCPRNDDLRFEVYRVSETPAPPPAPALPDRAQLRQCPGRRDHVERPPDLMHAAPRRCDRVLRLSAEVTTIELALESWRSPDGRQFRAHGSGDCEEPVGR